jgi:hypothetical protein
VIIVSDGSGYAGGEGLEREVEGEEVGALLERGEEVLVDMIEVERGELRQYGLVGHDRVVGPAEDPEADTVRFETTMVDDGPESGAEVGFKRVLVVGVVERDELQRRKVEQRLLASTDAELREVVAAVEVSIHVLEDESLED